MRKIIFIVISAVLIIVSIILFFVFQLLSSQNNSSKNIPIPTAVPLNQLQTSNQALPNVKYNRDKTNQMMNGINHRQPLSPEGVVAKQKLIANLGDKSGRVFSSSNVVIDYIKSPDLFQAEILTTNINLAKQDAVNFMLSAGFSPSDVCYLPLSFYLNSRISEQLRNSNIIFNPLPEGC